MPARRPTGGPAMTRALPRVAALVSFVFLATFAFAQQRQPAAPEKPAIPGGDLRILGPEGAARGSCPLKHTDVVANVAGFLGRTRVKQTFHNPLDEKIEAIYVFPLPSDAAVDEMIMTVGDRRIVGQVKKREEARQVYEQAKAAGHVASLLDQERPNVFTQSLANVEPGAQVVIEISYVETLKYEDGWYEFVFPAVVGPRYMPGQSAGKQGEGFAPDTTEVPDASKISPRVTPQGTRAGHDISLTVNVDAGMEIQEVECRSHAIVSEKPGAGQVSVALKNQREIPNKDFILRYRTATDRVADALLTHKDPRGSFFTLFLQPPQKVMRKEAVGRELVFVLDTSGSMQGFPITQAKFVMSKAVDSMGPQDTFNLITFSGDTNILWEAPRPNTPQNREEAQSFLAARKGSGGTEMMKAIEAALVKTKDANPQAAGRERIRVVCFMTDGYVGNDIAIIDAVKKNAGTTRVFSFGVGSSVNRFLLDGMAHAGRGEVEYVTLESKANEAAERFYKRIDAPVLTDVAIDWGGLPVADVYPRQVPDLFSDKPILVHGRLTGEVKGGSAITLRGNTVAGPFERRVEMKPAADASHAVLASLWARSKVTDLMMSDIGALQLGTFPEDLKRQIASIGTEFRLMTQFTSFVAVEEMTITKGGQAIKVAVPVEMPEGVSYEGTFGGKQVREQLAQLQANSRGAMFYGSARFAHHPGQQPAKVQFGQQLAVAPATTPAPAAGGAVAVAGDGTPVATGGQATEARRAGKKLASAGLHEYAADAKLAEEAAPDPAAKLHESLRDLAAAVEKAGTKGTLAVGDVVVKDYKVDVMIHLSDTSATTLEALKKLGFEQTGESRAVRLVIGTVDVRKLAELVKLEAVLGVKPVG
jgi:Ca-activated chloride channel family protein